MTIRQTKKNMGLLFLISILLLGTCLGNIQTGLFSAHALSVSDAASSDENALISPAGKSFPIQPYLTGKNSASQETAVHIKRSSQRGNLHLARFYSFLLSAGKELNSGKNFSSFFTVSDHIQILLGHMVIISYIHHQDGQKSYILPLFS